MPASLPSIAVVAGLIRRRGKLLICQRRHDGAFPLQWEFPGGKIEPGETGEQALGRELHEELGIVAEIGPELYRTRHDYPDAYTVDLIFYQVTSFEGMLRNLVFERIAWQEPACLPEFDFLAGDAELITLLSQGRLVLPHVP